MTITEIQNQWNIQFYIMKFYITCCIFNFVEALIVLLKLHKEWCQFLRDKSVANPLAAFLQ